MKRLFFLVFFMIEFVFAQVNAQQSSQQVADKIIDMKDVKQGSTEIILGERDPFRKPKYLEEEEDSEAKKTAPPPVLTEDEKLEAIRRWPVREYKIVAIMWNIENPKVMVVDKNKGVHILKKNQRIGNKSGIISAINEGEVMVTEEGVPLVLNIEKAEIKGAGGIKK